MLQDSRSATSAALADPTRRAILARLADGEASVGAPAVPFQMSLPAVGKHLKLLERAGLIMRYHPFWEGGFGRLDDYPTTLQT